MARRPLPPWRPTATSWCATPRRRSYNEHCSVGLANSVCCALHAACGIASVPVSPIEADTSRAAHSGQTDDRHVGGGRGIARTDPSGRGQHRHMAHAVGCSRSRCGDGRGDSVPCVPERDSRHGRRRVPRVDHDLARLREELRTQMPLSETRPRKRLTREESRARTRATLIAVGRRHFLRYGLGGAVAEKIAEDAGYSRGALYANFDGKEELFVAVIQEEQARHLNVFRSLLKEEPSSKKRLKKMRDTIADLMTDNDWIVLRAEFEVGALRSERIRKSFLEVHRQQMRDGGNLIRELLRSPHIASKLKPDDFITIIINLAHGLALTQRILGAELSQKSTQSLIQSLIDHLISSA